MFRNHKLTIGYVLAMVSICVAFWAYAIVVPTRAAYRSQTKASASARIAKFSVTAGEPTLVTADSVLDCNIEGDVVVYELLIQNDSEVDVEYRVSVTGYGDNVYCATTNGAGTLAANGDAAIVRISLTVIDEENKSQPIVLDEITATVIAEQKKPEETP